MHSTVAQEGAQHSTGRGAQQHSVQQTVALEQLDLGGLERVHNGLGAQHSTAAQQGAQHGTVRGAQHSMSVTFEQRNIGGLKRVHNGLRRRRRRGVPARQGAQHGEGHSMR